MLNVLTLEKSLAGFAGYVREHGLNVSVSEVADAVKSVRIIHPTSIQIFKNVVGHCFMKSSQDGEKYDKLFDQYFLREQKDAVVVAALALAGKEKNILPDHEEGGNDAQKQQGLNKSENIKGWRQILAESGDVPRSFALFLERNRKEAGLKLLKEPLSASQKNAILDAILKCTRSGKIKTTDEPEILKAIEEYSSLSKQIQKLAASHHRTEPVFGSGAIKRSVPDFSVDCAPELLETEIGKKQREMHRVLNMVARQIYIRMARWIGTASRKRVVDYKTTMKKSLATMGEPFTIVHRARKQRLRRLITICDVSGSVKYATELLLCFMYELHQIFEGRAKHHIFVSAVGDITPHFDRPTFEQCFDGVMRSAGIDYRGYSDYGVAFKMFNSEHNTIDRDTVVIILGDARNNKRDPGLKYLSGICSCAHTTVWLNPEPPLKWNSGDSIVSVYRKNVDHMFDVSKFGKLLNFVQSLPSMVLVR